MYESCPAAYILKYINQGRMRKLIDPVVYFRIAKITGKGW